MGRVAILGLVVQVLGMASGLQALAQDETAGPDPDELPILQLPDSLALPSERTSGDADLESLGPKRALRRQFIDLVAERYRRARSILDGAGLIPDGEVLFLELVLRRLLLANGLLAVKSGDRVLFNLAEFVNAVDFAIEVDEEVGTAAGWFRQEDVRFSLDVAARRAVVRGKATSWPVGQVLATPDGLLAHADLIEDWFGVELQLDLLRQVARLSSAARLPIEARLERVRRFERIADRQGDATALPEFRVPAKVIDYPNIDLQAAVGHRSGTAQGSEAIAQGSIQGGGDILFASGSYFAAVDKQRGLTNARFRLERDDLQTLAPGQPLTVAGIGDVFTPQLPLLGGNVLERGIVVTNESGEDRVSVGTTEIIGDVTVGWDVELYRNDLLIGFEPENLDGQHEFRDVELFPGQNVFRLVFYGPQGQVEEETRVVPLSTGVGIGGLPAFSASLTQQGRTLFNDPDVTTSDSDGGVRAAVDVSLPLPGIGFAELGYLSARNETERQHFLAARGITSLGPLLLDLSGAVSDSGGSTLALLTGGLVKGQQVRLSATHLRDYAPPTTGAEADVLGLGASVTGGIPLPVGKGVNYTVDTDWQRADTQRILTNALGLSSQVGRLNLGAEVERTQTDDRDGDRQVTVGGGAQGNLILGRNVVRATTNFAVAPEFALQAAEATITTRRFENVSASARVSHNFNTGNSGVDARADWDFGKGLIGPRFAYDSTGRLEASVQTRLSLGLSRDDIILANTPLSGRGVVQAVVFLDDNGDGLRNEGEQLLPEVAVEAVQERIIGLTDDAGRASLVGLSVGRKIDIRVSDEALGEAFMKPAVPGRSVRMRRGQTVTIELPVVRTGEIEGQVLQREDEGTRPVQTRTLVRLLSRAGTVVAKADVAFDGLFVVPDVAPGDYLLSVDPLSPDLPGAWREVSVAPERVSVVGDVVLVPDLRPSTDSDGAVMVVDMGRFRSEFGAAAQWTLLRRAFPKETRHLQRVATPRRGPDTDPVVLTLMSVGGAGGVLALCDRLKARVDSCRPRLERI